MEPSPTNPSHDRPAPPAPASPVALRRAPTLMASHSGGGHGEVQVWAPGALPVFISAAIATSLVTSSCLLYVVICELFRSGTFPPFDVLWACWFDPVLIAVGLLFAWARRSHIAVDEKGIALRDLFSVSGTKYIPWPEIRSMSTERFSLPGFEYLSLSGVRGARLNLVGYSRRAREEIRAAIAARANLAPWPVDPSILVAPSAPGIATPSLSLPGADDASPSGDLPAIPGPTSLSLRAADENEPDAPGEMECWRPSRAWLWVRVSILAAVLALLACGAVAPWSTYAQGYCMMGAMMIWLAGLSPALSSARRPQYIGADETQLMVVSSTGLHAIPWERVRAVEAVTEVTGRYLRVRTLDPVDVELHTLVISLWGFSSKDRRELLDTILAKACLHPNPANPTLYARDGSRWALPECADIDRYV